MCAYFHKVCFNVAVTGLGRVGRLTADPRAQGRVRGRHRPVPQLFSVLFAPRLPGARGLGLC